MFKRQKKLEIHVIMLPGESARSVATCDLVGSGA